eukprot:GHVH01009610.1.p1 GENE.GHVH01009610.1~~GHVH01009610.1.p1  ORF type:complete len:757 (+),score=58.80 GHVH01009610.1:23-2293(+)
MDALQDPYNLDALCREYRILVEDTLPETLKWLDCWIWSMLKEKDLQARFDPNIKFLSDRINYLAEHYFMTSGRPWLVDSKAIEFPQAVEDDCLIHYDRISKERQPPSRGRRRSIEICYPLSSPTRDVLHPMSTIKECRCYPHNAHGIIPSFEEAGLAKEMRGKKVAFYPKCVMFKSWGGDSITWNGCLFLLHMMSAVPSEIGPNVIPKDAIIFSIVILCAFIRGSIGVLGKGRHPDSQHCILLPFPDYFALSLVGSPDDDQYSERCQLLSYIQGLIGPIHEFSLFHGTRGKQPVTPRTRPNTIKGSSPNDNPMAVDRTGKFCHQFTRGLIVERMSITRMLCFLNTLGFFTMLPRLSAISQTLLGGYQPCSTTPKGRCHNARATCLSSLIMDMPFTLFEKNPFCIGKILGTGSEKTVFQVQCETLNNEKIIVHPMAIRLNTNQVEFELTRICASAVSHGLDINHYIDQHLMAPLMDSADNVLNSVISILEFIESCCVQMHALNEYGFIHRDIKLGNILASRPVDNTKRWFLLSDFGHACKLGTLVTCSSRSLADPCHLYCPATEKMDVWCIALSILKLISSQRESNPRRKKKDEDSIKVAIKLWYQIFLSEKDQFKQNSRLTKGNLEVPLYFEYKEKWSSNWDVLVWHQLAEHSELWSVYGPLPQMSGSLFESDWLYPLESMGFHGSSAIDDQKDGMLIFARDLLFALRQCMEIVDFPSRWSSRELLSFATFWISQINNRKFSSYFSINNVIEPVAT